MNITAFVDESWSSTGPYILGAALIPDDERDDVHDRMRGLRKDQGRKVHFHSESRARRRLITTAIVDLELDLLVATSEPAPTCSPERRRRAALKRLIGDLATIGIKRAVFESRGRADDQRDLKMMQHLRVSHELTDPMHLSFQPGKLEPCLWVADFLCGAIAQDYAGHPELKHLINPLIRVPGAPADPAGTSSLDRYVA